jgi:hypothetical protein
MIVAYLSGALALVCFVAAVRDLPFPFGRAEGTPQLSQVAEQELRPDTPVQAKSGQWVPVEASNNDDHFPRIESAVDSFGNRAEPDQSYAEGARLWSHPSRVLRPGQHVSFEIEVSDPNGEYVEIRVLCGTGEAEVAISPGGTVEWNVRDENIADPPSCIST